MDPQLQSLSDLKRKARHDKDEQDDTSQKRRVGDTSSITVNPVPQGEAHREGGSTPSLLSHDAYTVGWVCALPKEQTAAKAMLDRLHTRLRQPPSDTNAYTLGSIGDHNIVIACLPKGQVGTVSAANVASRMISTFPSIRFALMVGIGGGIPSKVRLGDVVVGTPTDTYPGVVQWDMGKATEGGNFKRTGTLNNPPTFLLTALTQIETDHDMIGSQIPDHLGQLQQRYPRLASKYLRSDSLRDVFFSSGSKHIDDGKGTCLLCDKTSATERELEDTRVHFGLVASGNQVIKDGIFRDRLDRDLGGNVLCVEMEAIGLVTNFPCLVIRGICDYADSHKNKDWQEHSAAAAAAFAKELLSYVEPAMIKAEPSANDVISEVRDVVRTTFVNVERLGRSIATKEDLAILDWLSPSTYGCQQSDIFERHQIGTGHWFLESTAFRDWRETPGKTLFCPGIPGSGKTIMTSVAINFLMKILGDERGMALAYVYCDYNKQAQQTLHHLLTSMLKQVCQTQETIPEAAKELYNRHKEVGTTPNLNEIIATLKAASNSCSRVFILVDALDEFGTLDNRRCLKDCRFAFLSHLAEVQEAAGINILYTSRHNAGIEEAIGSCLRQEIRAADEDIYRFIDSNLENVLRPIPPTPGLHDAIKTTIMGLVDGMFLLAQLFLDSLRGKTTASQIREALAWIEDRNQIVSKDEGNTGILYQAYDQAMTRIQEQLPGHRDLGMKTLAWIINTERPLTSLELQHALAIKKGQKYLDQENTSKIEVILSVCAGLVILDKESDIIRLAHFTTQEYFTWKQHFPDAQVEIATACATYLSFENFEHATRGHSVRGRRKDPNNLHLSPYAAIYWANHVRKARVINQSILDFLIEEKGVKAACTYSQYEWRVVDPEATWTSLHVVAPHSFAQVQLPPSVAHLRVAAFKLWYKA